METSDIDQSTLDPPKGRPFGPQGGIKGLCATCGKAARTPRAYYCEDHAPTPRKAGQKTTTAPGRTRVDRPGTVPPGAPPGTAAAVSDEEAKALKERKRADIATVLRTKLNPLLVTSFAKACAPAPPQAFYGMGADGPVLTTLGKMVALTDFSIDGLAWCLVNAEDVPQLKMVSAMTKSLTPYAAILGVVAITAFQGQKLMTLRTQIVAQAMAAQQTGQSDSGSGDTVAEPTAEQQSAPPDSPLSPDPRIPAQGRAPTSGNGYTGPVAVDESDDDFAVAM